MVVTRVDILLQEPYDGIGIKVTQDLKTQTNCRINKEEKEKTPVSSKVASFLVKIYNCCR